MTTLCLFLSLLLMLAMGFWSNPIFAAADDAAVTSTNAISDADREFGQLQVELMVADRPQMKDYAKKGDVIWNWVADQYSGASTGKRFYWNGKPDFRTPLRDGKPARPAACHNSGAMPWINVNETDPDGYVLSPPRMWESVVFEFLNALNDPAFEKLNDDAKAGKISKSEYEKEILRLEFLTEAKVLPLYNKLLSRKSEEVHSGDPGTMHFNDPSITFEQWYAKYKSEKTFVPFYAYQYDQYIAPHLKKGTVSPLPESLRPEKQR